MFVRRAKDWVNHFPMPTRRHSPCPTRVRQNGTSHIRLGSSRQWCSSRMPALFTLTDPVGISGRVSGRACLGVTADRRRGPGLRTEASMTALESCAWHGARSRYRFLHEVVESSSGANSNYDGRKACNDERAHSLSPASRPPPITPERDGRSVDIHKKPAKRAHVRAKVGTFSALQVGKAMSEPGREMLRGKCTSRFG